MNFLVLLGRIFFSLIFIAAFKFHLSPEAIAYATAQGVPFSNIGVPLSGVIALMGGLSIAVGYKAKWGAWLIVLFLVPVTVMMHNFWSISDPMAAMMQQTMFFKNLAMLGCALILTQRGAGPMSIDHRNASKN